MCTHLCVCVYVCVGVRERRYAHPCTYKKLKFCAHFHVHELQLTSLHSDRGQKLEQSYAFQQFSANVEEEESWISEKQHLLSAADLGDTMAAVQVRKGREAAVSCEVF